MFTKTFSFQKTNLLVEEVEKIEYWQKVKKKIQKTRN